jgi:hypothetical protein
MKTSHKAALLAVATLGVATGMVHLFLPGGLPALFAKAPTPPSSTPDAASAASTARPGPEEGPETELRTAERAYDAGEFSRAVDLFVIARADNTGDARLRATKGLQKAALAWALTAGALPASPAPENPDDEVARRQAEVEANPSERGWYDLTLLAAGCGLARKLPYFAEQAVRCAQSGGPVETRLSKELEKSGPRGSLLRDAMVAQGFLAPVDPVAAAAVPHPAAAKPATSPLSPPSGVFKPQTRVKLSQAVELERQGTAEFDLTGPDEPKRREHRKAAIDCLVKARNIYQEAEEEDPGSVELSRRLRAVMEMISHLHKESVLGD